MKKLMMVAMALIVACSASFAYDKAEMKQQRKERQEIRKASKKDLNERATKAARKEAKRLKKEGWTTSPGTLPLDKQLDRSYLMQMEYDENLFPKYIMADAQSIGIQTEVTALVENTVANKQLDANEAASIVETVMSSKNLISQSIGRTIPVVECYREVQKGGNKEVLVRLAYNGEMAKAAAQKAVRAELEKKGSNLHEQLDKVLGF